MRNKDKKQIITDFTRITEKDIHLVELGKLERIINVE